LRRRRPIAGPRAGAVVASVASGPIPAAESNLITTDASRFITAHAHVFPAFAWPRPRACGARTTGAVARSTG
jgi:hypothetical protein